MLSTYKNYTFIGGFFRTVSKDLFCENFLKAFSFRHFLKTGTNFSDSKNIISCSLSLLDGEDMFHRKFSLTNLVRIKKESGI